LISTTQLLAKHLQRKEEGTITGDCVLCSKRTRTGLKIKSVISNSFTAFELLQEGNCFCSDCATCFCKETRQSHWLITEQSFQQFKRAELLDIISNLPSEPFMLSITKNYKKYGFLFVANTINYSRETFSVAFEDRALSIKYDLFQEYLQLINKLREMKITKNELATGELYPSAITKIIETGMFPVIALIKMKCKNDNWLLALFVSK